MSAPFSISYFSSCHMCLLVLVLFHLCLSDQKSDDHVLCMDSERKALIQFKNNLIDEADRLASWVGEKSDCCQWAGIVCDNITGHVHEIYLRALDGHLDRAKSGSYKETREASKQRLRGHLSPSLLELKQLKHLDLSCNDFEEIQIPSFIGSLRNLRYLNLSQSEFGGIIPPQIGNLSELRVLSLGGFDGKYGVGGTLVSKNLKWLSSLRWLHHLDMSSTTLSNATDWFQVINTFPSLMQLHLSRCGLPNAHPHVPSLNVTSLSVLDLSFNFFETSMPRWIFTLTSLASLDLTSCSFHLESPVATSIYSFQNLTSLESLHVRGNDFMNSSSVFNGVFSSLVSLDMSGCRISSSELDFLHNLTSLLSLDLSKNKLTKPIPDSWGNLCNLRDIDLSSNDFREISVGYLLKNLFKCKSPSLESLTLINSGLSGPIPHLIGRLSSLKKLHLYTNKLNGSIPNSIGRLSSLEELFISGNQLSGTLPDSIGQLSKLKEFWISYNLLTGVLTEAHFAKLVSLTYLNGEGNNITLRVVENWIPPFQAQYLYLNSWNLGPNFPLWLQSQRDLIQLDISNTHISSIMPPESFWRSFPNLTHLDMSQNRITGRLVLGIPSALVLLQLSSNAFKGELPSLSNGSLVPGFLDLSNNSLTGSLHQFLCSNMVEKIQALNLGDNGLSGVIPECWEKWHSLVVLNMENNILSGEIPRTLGSLSKLQLLNMRGNKISGRLHASLMNLTRLKILQLGRNKLVGNIPSWIGTKLTLLRILNLRSNNLDGNIPDELCYLSGTQILDLADNYMSGNIPRCFNNFNVLSGKEKIPISELDDPFEFYFEGGSVTASDTLVMKGQERAYKSILRLQILLDLSNNNFSGHIPSELTMLRELKSLNLSKNQLTGRIPVKIGDIKGLETFDLSWNRLFGELPKSMSAMNSLSSFNVSYNNFTGKIPFSTQFQTFGESSFYGNFELCGAPLLSVCGVVSGDTPEDRKDNGFDWGLIISIVLGFVTGFWMTVAPLILNKWWRVSYFSFMRKLFKTSSL